MSRPPWSERRARRAWARANAVPLAVFFGAVLALGVWLGNVFALAAGLGGLGWVAWVSLKSD